MLPTNVDPYVKNSTKENAVSGNYQLLRRDPKCSSVWASVQGFFAPKFVDFLANDG